MLHFSSHVIAPLAANSLCSLAEMFQSSLVAVCFAVAAYAQNALTLESALDTARRTHPLLASTPFRMDAARAAVTQAGLRPNPRLTIQTENWHAPYIATDSYAYFSQTLEAPAKRGARMELAREPMVWWSLVSAFTFMFVLVLAANLFADAVRDAFDPRVR